MRKTHLEQIAANTRASLFYSALLVLLLAALGGAIVGAYSPENWHYGLVGSAILGLLVALISWNAGHKIVLQISHAREATPLEIQRLNNVTEEMAIAAGIPKPEVYIVDDPSPNAFATGRSPEEGIVVVTSGLMDILDRDELQGVVAHEIAHIRNSDVRLMTTLAVVAGLIPLLADLFLRDLWHGGRRRRSSNSGNAGALIFLAIAIVLAILAPLFSKLLELAVSRRREFLADATAAHLTRNPEGLASALNKISHPATQLESANRATEHMYIVNPFRPFEDRASSWFSTHPPIPDRIAALRNMAGVVMPATPRAMDDFSDMPPIPNQNRD